MTDKFFEGTPFTAPAATANKLPSFFDYSGGMSARQATKDSKDQWAALPPSIQYLCDAATVGYKKYGPFSYLKPGTVTRSQLVSALFRHLFLAWWKGEWYDKDDGQRHWGAVAWNALAIAQLEDMGIGEEERPWIAGK